MEVVNDKDYKKGYNEAMIYLGIAYNRLPLDDPDPIIPKAKELAPKLKQQNESLGISDGGDHLAVAVYMLTFYKYVGDKWWSR